MSERKCIPVRLTDDMRVQLVAVMDRKGLTSLNATIVQLIEEEFLRLNNFGLMTAIGGLREKVDRIGEHIMDNGEFSYEAMIWKVLLEWDRFKSFSSDPIFGSEKPGNPEEFVQALMRISVKSRSDRGMSVMDGIRSRQI